MKMKFNLLMALFTTLGAWAQHQNPMKHKADSITQGHKIKGGKLIYSEITIKAPVEKVWQQFTDFESYAAWNPFIKALKGTPSPGNKIEVVLTPPGKKGMVFKPEVLVFDHQYQFRWIGKLLIKRIFDGEHTFMLLDNKDGTVTFIQFERFRGILIPFLKRMLNENTRDGFNQMNEALKQKCEAPNQ